MKMLIYCTKAKKRFRCGSMGLFSDELYRLPNGKIKFGCSVELMAYDNYTKDNFLNGKIVAECDFEVEEIKRINTVGDWFMYGNQDEILEQAKLKFEDFIKYLNGKNGYAIHIKNLHIFEKPKELSDYGRYDFKNANPYVAWKENYYPIEKAPQNMMYVTDLKTGEDYILISIQPQWVCKILNGEKTIEVRKVVLKGMLENDFID